MNPLLRLPSDPLVRTRVAHILDATARQWNLPPVGFETCNLLKPARTRASAGIEVTDRHAAHQHVQARHALVLDLAWQWCH